jgi:hypothetical protein
MLMVGPNEAASAFGPAHRNPKLLARIETATKLVFDIGDSPKPAVKGHHPKNRRDAQRKDGAAVPSADYLLP